MRLLKFIALPMMLATPALAGPLERACLAASRDEQVETCRCIQTAADRVLALDEQNIVAKFFQDPHLSQELRTSRRARDADLWARYKDFGAQAEQLCARG